MSTLGPAFFARDVLEVAPDLIGRHLVSGSVVLRITETEAYRWPGDTACHAKVGKTARTAPFFGPPGHLYVYLCYGLHRMLNLVTGPEEDAQAVLVRSASIVSGHDQVRARRNGRLDLTGPGKVGQALALDTVWSGQPLSRRTLWLEAGEPPAHLRNGARVGIDYALPEHRELPWRWADPEHRVSHSSTLSR